MDIQELKKQKVVILGLGVNNQALVEYLLKRGVGITIRDRLPDLQEEFWKKYPQYKENELVKWEIMENILKGLDKFGVVFRSPSIPYLSPEIQKAKGQGVVIYSQTKLFFDLCPAPIIGISGTKGKGTTATLLYQILQVGWKKGKVYLAGNIGLDPFSFVDKLQETDLVILELSSYQLQDLHKSPHIAIMLRVSVDHLDHHKNIEEYRVAKQPLLRWQNEDDLALVNADDPNMDEYANLTRAQVYRYSRYQPRRNSIWVDNSTGDEIVFVQLGEDIESFSLTGRRLIGEHNLENILPAILTATMLGVSMHTIRRVVLAFPGLEHRLALVGTYHKVNFYDDSIATTPAACLVAISSFWGRPIHLIVGGRDKGQDYTGLAADIVQHCATVSFLPGKATARLKQSLRQALNRFPTSENPCQILDDFNYGSTKVLTPFPTKDEVMENILKSIVPHLKPNDIVLLSPTTASDQPFKDYKERGEAFIRAMKGQYARK
jgi:UDP-N-acetylmuramoylalanine--D-glutamate ligase